MSALRLSHPLHDVSDVDLHARLRARSLAHRLDEELADGADPRALPELAWRAQHLLRPRSRAQLAHGLRRAVTDARSPRITLSAAIRVARPAVRACAPDMLALAAELGADDVRVRGVALTRRLLTDGAGPLFCATSQDELRRVVDAARQAL
jgi:hypothetical protein